MAPPTSPDSQHTLAYLSPCDLKTSPTDRERRYFRLDDFPKTDSERREFIFMRTGFPAKPMELREWYLFNTSLNNGYRLGLPERTLKILSLMDQALSRVKRFNGAAHMNMIVADSTAAHTKQVMNIIHSIFEKAATDLDTPIPEDLRIQAMLGAWVHDMGELVIELATADDVFRLPEREREVLQHAKNTLEERLFAFCLRIATHAVDQEKPEHFILEIEKMRVLALSKSTPMERIAALTQYMDTTDISQMPTLDTEALKPIVSAYHVVETPGPGNFLHPLVKTLECVEGQRYMQRNALHTEATELRYATSHTIVSGVLRSEKRLPILFREAGDNLSKLALARRTAEFTYRSLARCFLPERHDHVSLAPEWIDRKGVITELDGVDIREERLASVRERTQAKLAEMAGKKQQNPWDTPIMPRRKIGLIYRAAERAVMNREAPFAPVSTSLIDYKATPEIPKPLQMLATQLESRYPEPAQAKAA
jgi:hypothetical protein